MNSSPSWHVKHRTLLIVLAVLGGSFVLCCGMCGIGGLMNPAARNQSITEQKHQGESESTKRTPETTLREAKASELLDPAQLRTNFNENEIASNANYKDKTLMVEGIVFSVQPSTDRSRHEICLCDEEGIPVMNCLLTKDASKSPELLQLSRGKKVRIIGICKGKITIRTTGISLTLPAVLLEECHFISINK